MPGRRIASFLPSATEMVCAVGCAERLVCRSHECDYPSTVADVPVVTRPRIDADGNGRAIGNEVKDLAAKSQSIFEIDWDKLKEVEPDIILTGAIRRLRSE